MKHYSEWSDLLAFTCIIRRLILGVGEARETEHGLWAETFLKAKESKYWCGCLSHSVQVLQKAFSGEQATSRSCALCAGPQDLEARGRTHALQLFGSQRTKRCRVSVARDAKKLVSLPAGGSQTIFHQSSDICAFWELSELQVLPVESGQPVSLYWNGLSEGEQCCGNTSLFVKLCSVRLRGVLS